MIWSILTAVSMTGLAWVTSEKTMHITMMAKIDIIFYMMIFGLIWSLVEVMRMNETVKQAEMMQMYEAGKADALKGKNE